jgi:hypothetical protein
MSSSAVLSFDQLVALASALGTTDAPCPLCSSGVSARGARRRVLRIYREAEDFIGFACARCGEKGWARDSGNTSRRLPPERLASIRRDAAERRAAEQAESVRKARWLWSKRAPIAPGTPPFVYLREARRYLGPIGASLGYLRPRNSEHHHAMIAAFGLATEPEPGVLAIPEAAIFGVHLTLLKPDGTGKADVDSAKKIIGRGSEGHPIVLAQPNDLLGVAVTEGVEDGLSVHAATGLGAWAAGAAGRMPALANTIPSFIDCVTVVVDADPNGRKNAQELAALIRARGINALLQEDRS